MEPHEARLKRFMQDNHIRGELLHFEQSCHSAQEAAAAVNAQPHELVKSICLIDDKGDLIVAIVTGDNRVNLTNVANILGIEKPRPATTEEILRRTGYPCGGTPPIGYAATFLIDTNVMALENVYAGGGSEHSLVKISTKDMRDCNNGSVCEIRK
ncbi:MAG: YbaK/EbsC family protein [Nanoarchaeota archaeon]